MNGSGRTGSERGRRPFGRAAAFAPVLLLALVMMGCSGGSWPKLVDVERPRESETYTVPAPVSEAPTADTRAPAPPPPPGAAIELTSQSLAGAAARLDKALAGMAAADDAYGTALSDFLAVSGEGQAFTEALNESWALAQYRLTRLSAAVDAVAVVNEELAALGVGAGAASSADLSLALGRQIERAGSALNGRERALLIENNRLAVLTPAEAGAPGPNAIERGDRAMFVRITFNDPEVAFADALAAPIERALQVAADLRFDVIATGADRAASQAHLRRVTAALLKLGVPRDQIIVAVEVDGVTTPQVEIYVRAKSA